MERRDGYSARLRECSYYCGCRPSNEVVKGWSLLCSTHCIQRAILPVATARSPRLYTRCAPRDICAAQELHRYAAVRKRLLYWQLSQQPAAFVPGANVGCMAEHPLVYQSRVQPFVSIYRPVCQAMAPRSHCLGHIPTECTAPTVPPQRVAEVARWNSRCRSSDHATASSCTFPRRSSCPSLDIAWYRGGDYISAGSSTLHLLPCGHYPASLVRRLSISFSYIQRNPRPGQDNTQHDHAGDQVLLPSTPGLACTSRFRCPMACTSDCLSPSIRIPAQLVRHAYLAWSGSKRYQ